MQRKKTTKRLLSGTIALAIMVGSVCQMPLSDLRTAAAALTGVAASNLENDKNLIAHDETNEELSSETIVVSEDIPFETTTVMEETPSITTSISAASSTETISVLDEIPEEIASSDVLEEIIPTREEDVSEELLAASEGSFSYEIVNNSSVKITGYSGSNGDVTIPAQIEGFPVTEIGKGAFSNSGVTSIQFPSSLVKINESAFSGCASLNNVQFNEGLTLVGALAFNGCSSLEKAELPDSVTEIDSCAFRGCTNLTYFKYPLSWAKVEYTWIGVNMYLGAIFSNCSKLASIEIPEGVSVIPSNAFAGMQSLTEISFPSTLKTVGESAFSNCTNLSMVNFNEGLSKIEASAFSGCSSLERVELPNSVSQINSCAFRNCINLSYFKYPMSWYEVEYAIVGATVYHGYIFDNCPKLVDIEIPEGVTAIPTHAFAGMKSLTHISFPNSLRTVGTSAFYLCSNLGNVNFNENLTTIKAAAFDGCSSLERVELPDSVSEIDSCAFRNCTNLVYFRYPASWSNVKYYSTGNLANMNTIYGYIFNNCPKLVEIDIPDGITKIPTYAFAGMHTLTEVVFPKSLKTVGEGAFNECTNLVDVRFNEGLYEIEKNAFFGCASLQKVVLPESVDMVGNKAFSNCPLITVYCPLKLYVISLIDSGVPVVIDDTLNRVSEIIDRTKTHYTTNTNTAGNGNRLSVTCVYECLPDVFSALSNLKVSFKVSGNAAVTNAAVYVDGELVRAEWDDASGLFTIPISNRTGRINFVLERTEACVITSYAIFSCVKDGKTQEELLGILSENEPSISVDAPTNTSKNTIAINGYSIPDSKVSVYVDGTLAKTVKSNKVGSYNTELTLTSPSDGRKYLIEAQSDSNSSLRASKTVTFSSKQPEIEGFELTFNGKTYDLYKDARYNITLGMSGFAGQSLRFKISMKNYENIEYVRVTSTKNGIKKYIEGQWSEADQAFVAEGLFNNDPTSTYVPGKIAVEYIVKQEKTPFSVSKFNQIFTDLVNASAIESNNFDVTQSIKPDGTQEYTLDVSEIPQFRDVGLNMLKMTVKETVKSAGMDISDYISSGKNIYSYVFDSSSDKYIMNLDYSDLKTYVMVIDDIDSNKFVKIAIEKIGDSVKSPTFDNCTGLLSIFGTAKSWLDIEDDYEELVDNIYSNSRFDAAQTAEALKKAEELRKDREMYLLLTTLMTAINLSTGGIGGLPFSLMMGSFGVLSNYFFEIRAANILQVNFPGKISWHIDPSGYVYEAVTSNRLSNVKASVYCILNDDSTNFWDQNEIDPAKAVLWDASEYDQENPTYTDNIGYYAWDVPEGWWQVKYELDGYETTYSEWMSVPPPQLNVNIGMVSKAAPHVIDVAKTSESVVVTFDKYIDPATASGITLYDGKGTVLSYTLQYNKEEADVNGMVYAREFTMILSDSKAVVEQVMIPETVKSYAGISVEEYRKEFDAVSHDWNEGTVTKEATCTEEGEKTLTCRKEGCAETKIEKIAALGHDYGNWEIAIEPNFESSGEAKRVCIRDESHVEKQEIPALNDTSVWILGEKEESTTNKKGYQDYISVYGIVRIELPLKEVVITSSGTVQPVVTGIPDRPMQTTAKITTAVITTIETFNSTTSTTTKPEEEGVEVTETTSESIGEIKENTNLDDKSANTALTPSQKTENMDSNVEAINLAVDENPTTGIVLVTLPAIASALLVVGTGAMRKKK